MTENTDALEDSSASLLNVLQHRANNLLADLRAYQECLKAHSKQGEVEIRTFKRGVESEVKTLNAASDLKDQASESASIDFEIEEWESKRLHALRSSNLPFYEAVWAVARHSQGILALGKRVYCDGQTSLRESKSAKDFHQKPVHNGKSEKRSANVDIVTKDGLEWIKVSTITEKRLLFEIAKEGWESYGAGSDSEDYNSDEEKGSSRDTEHEANQLELVKLARVLYSASRETRIHFKHPRVRFILPKIQEGLFNDVDAVIKDIRSSGIIVTCGEIGFNTGGDDSTVTRELHGLNLYEDRDMIHLLPSASFFSPMPSPILNIDCTILLALISDISHIPEDDLPPHPMNTAGTYHKAITRQIGTENSSPLLPSELYPLISGRSLLCTSHAAQRMREIVQTMGTDTEKSRAGIILAENEYRGASSGMLHDALQQFSCHDFPQEIRLPIQVTDFDFDFDPVVTNTADSTNNSDCAVTLSQADLRILGKLLHKLNLSTINKSVFLYGWTKGIVTVTSNRVVASGIVKCINEILDEEEAEQGVLTRKNGEGTRADVDFDDVVDHDFEGPRIYVCETARSLIGKEKQSTTRKTPKQGARDQC